MLNFLKVSEVVSTFFKTFFQSTLQNLPICFVVRKYIESRSKKNNLEISLICCILKGFGA
jgi:hypothetical protein